MGYFNQVYKTHILGVLLKLGDEFGDRSNRKFISITVSLLILDNHDLFSRRALLIE